MVNQKNYYEMTYRLYNAMCELVNTDKQDFTELYEKSRAIIFDYKILEEKYLKTVRSIYKYTQDKKFIDLCEKNYNLIKENINKRANDRGVALKYNKDICRDSETNYEANAQFKSSIKEQFENLDEELSWENWDEILEYNADVVYYTFTEHPEYFYYSSCQALLFDDFTQYDDEDIELIKDTHIEICLSLKQFYMDNFYCSVDIPKDFEYYISAYNFSVTDDFNSFDKVFYITALYYVLADLYKYVQACLNELYGIPIKYIDKDKHKSKISEMHVVKINNSGNSPIEIDNIPLEKISAQQIRIIKMVKQQQIKGNAQPYKNEVCKINKAIRDAIYINENFIKWNKQKKEYCVTGHFDIDIIEE